MPATMAPDHAHESMQAEYRAATIAMLVFSIVAVVLRFLSRWRKGLKIGLDDYTVVMALIFLIALAGLMLVSIDYGMGLHSDTLPVHNSIMISKLLLVFECIYAMTLVLTKLSILLMYARIFPTRNFRIASFVLGGISVAWAIAIVLVFIFQCTPIARAWDKSIPGHCINLKASFFGNAVPNIVTDIAILALPVRVVWGLHVNLTHRLSVIGIFLLGSFVVFTSIYRFVTLFAFDPSDIAWTLGNSSTWCIIESATGIICACMPTLRPLFVMVSSKFRSQNGSSRTRTTDTTPSRNYGVGYSGGRLGGGPRSGSRIRTQVFQTDDGTDDEVPLNKIRVQQDLMWQESRNDSLRDWK